MAHGFHVIMALFVDEGLGAVLSQHVIQHGRDLSIRRTVGDKNFYARHRAFPNRNGPTAAKVAKSMKLAAPQYVTPECLNCGSTGLTTTLSHVESVGGSSSTFSGFPLKACGNDGHL